MNVHILLIRIFVSLQWYFLSLLLLLHSTSVCACALLFSRSLIYRHIRIAFLLRYYRFMHRRLPFATNDNDTLTQNTDSEFKMKRNDLSFIHPPTPGTRHNDDDANDTRQSVKKERVNGGKKKKKTIIRETNGGKKGLKSNRMECRERHIQKKGTVRNQTKNSKCHVCSFIYNDQWFQWFVLGKSIRKMVFHCSFSSNYRMKISKLSHDL